MRFVIAALAFVLSIASFVGAWVAQNAAKQAEAFVGMGTVSASTPYIVIPGSQLTEYPGAQSLDVRSNSGEITMVEGRETDILGWLQTTPYSTVSFNVALDERTITPALPATETPVEVPADVTNPAGSDLWTETYTGTEIAQDFELPEGQALLIFVDGVAPVDAQIDVSWPRDTRAPLVGPLVLLGSILAAAAVLAFVLGYLRWRRSRGPQRRSASRVVGRRQGASTGAFDRIPTGDTGAVARQAEEDTSSIATSERPDTAAAPAFAGSHRTFFDGDDSERQAAVDIANEGDDATDDPSTVFEDAAVDRATADVVVRDETTTAQETSQDEAPDTTSFAPITTPVDVAPDDLRSTPERPLTRRELRAQRALAESRAQQVIADTGATETTAPDTGATETTAADTTATETTATDATSAAEGSLSEASSESETGGSFGIVSDDVTAPTPAQVVPAASATQSLATLFVDSEPNETKRRRGRRAGAPAGDDEADASRPPTGRHRVISEDEASTVAANPEAQTDTANDTDEAPGRTGVAGLWDRFTSGGNRSGGAQ